MIRFLATVGVLFCLGCGHSGNEKVSPAAQDGPQKTPTVNPSPKAPTKDSDKDSDTAPDSDHGENPLPPNQPISCEPAKAPFGGGNGTPADPYLICSPENLMRVASHSELFFKLSTDIELKGDFSSIPRLSGGIDGNGKTISGLRVIAVDKATSAGLIGQLDPDGEIKNLNLKDAFVISELKIPMGALVGINMGKITGCSILSSDFPKAATRIVGKQQVGGMIGLNYEGTLTDCKVQAKVFSPLLTLGNSIGGLVGESVGGALYSSISSGFVQGKRNVGGLVGALTQPRAGQNASSKIVHCESTAEVSGDTQIGGLVGMSGSDGFSSDSSSATTLVENSSASGKVSGGSRVGGLIGYMTRFGIVRNSSASGNVFATESSKADALVGFNASGKVINSIGTGSVQKKPSLIEIWDDLVRVF